jgi:hypothetical protein
VPTTSRVSTVYASSTTPCPDAAERHLLNRLTPGYAPWAWDQLRAAGSPSAWFEAQLNPETVPEDPLVGELDAWFPRIFDTPEVKFDERKAERIGADEYGYMFGSWTILRQIHSRRGVLERMVELWSNHFNVGVRDSSAWPCRFDLDRIVRRHALGSFEDLLREVTLSNAMQSSLDNFRSTKGAPNENHGRELLELHTVTRAAGYSEKEVKASAALLSGWTLDWGKTFTVRYKPSLHTTGPVRVLGFVRENAADDGSADSLAYLRFLARHRLTAQNVCRKLVTTFVSDDAPASLVDSLARVFQQHGTQIKPVLRALFASPEFRAAHGTKVRTPIEDLVATARSLDVRPQPPTSAESYANLVNTIHGADMMYFWPAPNGRPITDPPWCSSSRILHSMRMHWNLAGRTNPTREVVYRSPASWLPEDPVRLDVWVDHLSRTWLGTPADDRVRGAVVQSTGYAADTVVTATHPLCAGWSFLRLASSLLDSPDLMRR